MDDLVAFLNARLADDERPVVTARMRREIAAKRALIAFAFKNAESVDGEWGNGHRAAEIESGQCDEYGEEAAMGILMPLAAVYSDHPDYRPEWKPEPLTAGR